MALSGLGRESVRIDPMVFHERLVSAIEANEELRSKSGILVIGNTRAGKSTFISYMVGCEMDSRRGEPVYVTSRPGGVELPVISHEVRPETSVITGYDIGEGLTLLDCPGFGDDREEATIGRVRDAVVSLGIDHVAKQVLRAVQGIVVIMPVSSIQDNAAAFKVLLKNLLGFLNVPEYDRSIQWIFTR